MANRVSEPAPSPPPAAPAAPPPAPVSTRSPEAQKMGIPDFDQGSGTDAVAISWNDYDANDGGGMPTGKSDVNMEGTNDEGAGRPRKVGKSTVNVAGTDADADPDVHLDARAAEGDDDVVAVGTKGQPGDDEDAPVVVKPNASERRRLALEALSREQQTRAIETNLIAERSKREALEGKLKTASLGELLKLRGFDRDDALEALIAGKEGATEEDKLTPEQRETKRLSAEVADLKKDRDERVLETKRLQYENVMATVGAAALKVDTAPVVHAAIKHGTIVDKDDAGKPLTASEWIYGLAMAEWEKGGAKAGTQKQYLRAATEVLEDKLTEDNDPIVAAVIAKRGGGGNGATARAAAPATAPRPPSLRRPSARPDARPAPLPRDRDALDQELKRRFNLR